MTAVTFRSVGEQEKGLQTLALHSVNIIRFLFKSKKGKVSDFLHSS